jgi:hypothetical protein
LPSLEQKAAIANVLEVDIEYLLGIDKEAEFISDFLKAFRRITTTNKFFDDDSGVFDKDDLIFDRDKNYLVLSIDENMVKVIEDMATANNLENKIGEAERKTILNRVKRRYHENKEKTSDISKYYFLISGEQMEEIIENEIDNKGYLKNLFNSALEIFEG